LHQMSYFTISPKEEDATALLAVSTEDGRILLYDPDKTSITAGDDINGEKSAIPAATLVATVGGKAAGVTTRIKDFEVLFIKPDAGAEEVIAIITASSNGTIRVIQIPMSELVAAVKGKKEGGQQPGTVIGTYETGERITCLKAFVMLPPKELDEDDFGGFDTEDSVESESESDEE